MNFLSLELKYNKVSEKQTSNSNTNIINNNIILGNVSKNAEIPNLNNNSVSKSDSPNNIKQFKEALISILISYFKDNVILLNNLVELSDKIITKLRI
jgi:hypothetical protein